VDLESLKVLLVNYLQEERKGSGKSHQVKEDHLLLQILKDLFKDFIRVIEVI
jgi:hypothetical protein